ncbi:hypothetical protein LI328DRAFT_134329, partial [Trichoderma asperelloides]
MRKYGYLSEKRLFGKQDQNIVFFFFHFFPNITSWALDILVSFFSLLLAFFSSFFFYWCSFLSNPLFSLTSCSISQKCTRHVWLSCVSYLCNWGSVSVFGQWRSCFSSQRRGAFLINFFWCKGLTFLQMKSDSLGWALGMVGY